MMIRIFALLIFLLMTSPVLAGDMTLSGELNVSGDLNMGGVETKYLMPLGDSITFGIDQTVDSTGYRFYLWPLTNETYQYRGGQMIANPTPSLIATWGRHDGKGGDTSTQVEVRIDEELDIWMNNSPGRSIILLHIGTNDITTCTDLGNDGAQCSSAELDAIVTNVNDILDLIFAHDPKLIVLVALIVPRQDPADAPAYQVNDDTTSYNTKLNTSMLAHPSLNINVFIVDMRESAGFDLANDLTSGGVHPDNSGFSFMADQWAGVINGL